MRLEFTFGMCNICGMTQDLVPAALDTPLWQLKINPLDSTLNVYVAMNTPLALTWREEL